jgi:hypothetical protein
MPASAMAIKTRRFSDNASHPDNDKLAAIAPTTHAHRTYSHSPASPLTEAMVQHCPRNAGLFVARGRGLFYPQPNIKCLRFWKVGGRLKVKQPDEIHIKGGCHSNKERERKFSTIEFGLELVLSFSAQATGFQSPRKLGVCDLIIPILHRLQKAGGLPMNLRLSLGGGEQHFGLGLLRHLTIPDCIFMPPMQRNVYVSGNGFSGFLRFVPDHQGDSSEQQQGYLYERTQRMTNNSNPRLGGWYPEMGADM